MKRNKEIIFSHINMLHGLKSYFETISWISISHTRTTIAQMVVEMLCENNIILSVIKVQRNNFYISNYFCECGIFAKFI